MQFRDPASARALGEAIAREVRAMGRRRITLMHVCGSHEQAIARFGLRSALPEALEVVMGPGCPVCVTDPSEVDEAVALALSGRRVVTYGDMVRVPGSGGSLSDARAEGARVEVVYGPAQALEVARAHPSEEVVFFASGFETTAVTTAAVIAQGLPPNLSVLTAHRYIPPAMQAVAGLPGSRVAGFLAAGHAAAITGSAVFEPLARERRLPVVVAGFEPLDVLAALVALLALVREGRAEVVNAYPRAVSGEGNLAAQALLWRVFELASGPWRGLGEIPHGTLRLRPAYAPCDARVRFAPELRSRRARDLGGAAAAARRALEAQCRCGQIMTGQAQPTDCALFGGACTPEQPVGACMVSSEGSCRIWHTHAAAPEPVATGRGPSRPATAACASAWAAWRGAGGG